MKIGGGWGNKVKRKSLKQSKMEFVAEYYAIVIIMRIMKYSEYAMYL